MRTQLYVVNVFFNFFFNKIADLFCKSSITVLQLNTKHFSCAIIPITVVSLKFLISIQEILLYENVIQANKKNKLLKNGSFKRQLKSNKKF